MKLPVVALRDTVFFPGMVLPLRIGRPLSVRAVEEAHAQRGKVLLVAERDGGNGEDVQAFGTIGQVAQLVRLPDGTYQALIQGLTRARVYDAAVEDGALRAVAIEVEDPPVERTVEVEGLMREVVGQIDRYAELSKDVPDGAAEAAKQLNEPGQLADAVAYSPDMTPKQRQELLEMVDPIA